MSRWHRYWFADGGRLSVAIVRVAIAVAVWLVLTDMKGSWPANAPGAATPPDVYRPIGVWMLFGGAPPSATVIDLLWIVARISTAAMLLGFVSRAATALSFVSAVALASLYYSGFGAWSHAYNVVLLAQLALLGARCGDALSVDALVRRLRGLAPLDVPRGYQWSIRLVQLAVAVMFASGMFTKVVQNYHPTLAWALSDNLRHHLVVRFDLAGLERTAIADWIIDDVWKFRTAAMLNLVAQTLPLVACFLMRRPVLRAACGAFFVIETIGLAFVMDLWNLHWLPLAVVFVDWDALIQKVRRSEATPPPVPAQWRPPRHVAVFVGAFVIYDLVTAFVPRIDQRLNTYPFSRFPMFAAIRARPPYDSHLPYSLAGGHFEIISNEPVPAHVYRWIDHAYRRTFAVRDRDELRKRLASILADAQQWHPAIQGLRCYFTIFEVPAYPARAVVQRRPIAILGEAYLDGTFRSLLGRVRTAGQTVTLTPGETAESVVAIEHYVDERPEPTQVEASGPPWRYGRPAGKKVAFVAVLRDSDGQEQRWLVATTPR